MSAAEECLKAIETQEEKYVRPPELVDRCLSDEDLKQVPRYGYDLGKPLVKRIEVLFYLRAKVEKLREDVARLQ